MAIGTPGRFGSSWHALLALLDAGGLTEDDVTIREYPQFNQVDGLSNGDVDLITGFRNNEPLRLEARGMDVGLLTVDDVAPLPGPGVIVGDELLAADPELVERLRARDGRGPGGGDRGSGPRLRGGRGRRCRPSPRIRTSRAPCSTRPSSCGPATASRDGVVDVALWESGYETMRAPGVHRRFGAGRRDDRAGGARRRAALGRLDRLTQDHHRRHRADAARDRADGADHRRDRGELDVADDPAAGDGVDAAVDDHGRPVDHLRADEPGDAGGGDEDLGAARLARQVARGAMADHDGGVARQKSEATGRPTTAERPMMTARRPATGTS